MNLHKLIFTNNACYRAGRRITPKGIMVHSTGANNPWLKRYVGPDDGLLGKNQYNNHWNQPMDREVCVHAFIGKLADGTVATYQTLPWDYRGWHCAGSGNDTHISFEICEDDLTDAAYLDKVYNEAVDLCVYLCELYGLTEQDITCQNGYIHVLGDVLVPPSNMADELEKQEDCSLFSSFLDRFTMPVVIGKTAGGDNIYRKVYFAAKGSANVDANSNLLLEEAGGTGLSQDSAGRDMATLAYDPTWHHNTYSSETYQQNMAAMFVPTDQALNEWWNSSTGQLVMNGKSSWNEVENSLLNVLINVHMKENFLNSTPSNFARILNDGNREQGITEGDVVRTVLANNGVIYIVNKVYTPDSYISVMAPLHNVEELTIMSRAVRCTDQTQYIPDGYGTYLNSMESQFTFLIPTNQALTDYHDPIYSQAAWAGNSAASRQISF